MLDSTPNAASHQQSSKKKPLPEDFSSGGGPATGNYPSATKKATEPLNFYFSIAINISSLADKSQAPAIWLVKQVAETLGYAE